MRGFTLIELLVALAIVSILAAYAVPQYHEYRQRAFDMRAQYDLHNVAQAEEIYFLDNERYFSCSGDKCTELPGIARLSKGVKLSVTATEDGFEGRASHSQGSGKVFQYSSADGGFVEAS